MALTLEQLVYTSSPGSESVVIASPQMPDAAQQRFIEDVVNPYWADQSFVGIQFRAAYLHQISSEEILFGWLYCRASASDPKGWIPHFVCYYLPQALNGPLIEQIFEILERGPYQATEFFQSPEMLEVVELSDTEKYNPSRPGVEIFPSVRARSRLLFDKGKLLHFFLPVEEIAEQSGGEDITELMAEGDIGTRTQIQIPEKEILTTLEPQPLAVPIPTVVKVGLLIGVSDCDLGFDEIPAVEADIESLRTVLLDPNMGNFTQVKTLLNPDRQVMAEAIEGLLSSCPPDSLALLYFSGYGVWDNQGTFCLTTGVSRRGQQRKIVRSTIIPSEFLNAVMRDCPAQNKLLLLDCCLSDDSDAAGDASRRRQESLRQQLNAPGLITILSASDLHESSLQKGNGLSAYTFYLVEGLKTGMADQNADRMITISEWHDYAMRKVQLASPAIRPLLIENQVGSQQLAIAQISADVVSLKYRREVERCVRNGYIPLVNDLILSNLQEKLDLTAEEADTIKAEVLKPHQDYQNKLQEYAQVFMEHIQSDDSKKVVTTQLGVLQTNLGLTDIDTEPLRSEMVQQLRASQMPVTPPRATGSFAYARLRALSVATTPENRPQGLRALWFKVTDAVDHGTQTLQQNLPTPLHGFFAGKSGQTKLKFLLGGILLILLTGVAVVGVNALKPRPERVQTSYLHSSTQ
jgi:hypothetical protein